MLPCRSTGRTPSAPHRIRATAARVAMASGCALAFALPAAARAQSAVQTGSVESPPGGQIFPILGARFGMPQRVSVTAGVGLEVGGVPGQRDASQEVLLALAPGLGAERASLTYVYSTGRYGGGVAVGPSVLRTVRHPWNAPANATYVGIDLAVLPIIAIGPRVGLFRRVSTPASDTPWLMTFDFGFGF